MLNSEDRNGWRHPDTSTLNEDVKHYRYTEIEKPYSPLSANALDLQLDNLKRAARSTIPLGLTVVPTVVPTTPNLTPIPTVVTKPIVAPQPTFVVPKAPPSPTPGSPVPKPSPTSGETSGGSSPTSSSSSKEDLLKAITSSPKLKAVEKPPKQKVYAESAAIQITPKMEAFLQKMQKINEPAAAEEEEWPEETTPPGQKISAAIFSQEAFIPEESTMTAEQHEYYEKLKEDYAGDTHIPKRTLKEYLKGAWKADSLQIYIDMRKDAARERENQGRITLKKDYDANWMTAYPLSSDEFLKAEYGDFENYLQAKEKMKAALKENAPWNMDKFYWELASVQKSIDLSKSDTDTWIRQQPQFRLADGTRGFEAYKKVRNSWRKKKKT